MARPRSARRRWRAGACTLALLAAPCATTAPAGAALVVARDAFATSAGAWHAHAARGGAAKVAEPSRGAPRELQLYLGRAGALARARRALRATSAPLVVRLAVRVDAGRAIALDVPVLSLRDGAGRSRVTVTRRGVDGRLVLAAGRGRVVGPVLRAGRATTIELRLQPAGSATAVRVAAGRTSAPLRVAGLRVAGLQLGGAAARRAHAPGRAAATTRLRVSTVIVARPRPPVTRILSRPAALSRAAGARIAFAIDDPGATAVCSVDGRSARCASPLSLPRLAEGPHTVVVRATDSLGASERVPPRVRFTLDRTAPNTSLSDGPAGGVAGSTVRFAVAADEAATFRCSIDGRPYTACSAALVVSGLAAGAHVIRAIATDAAGNVDPTPAVARFAVAPAAPGIATRVPGPGDADVASTAGIAVTFTQDVDGATVTSSTLRVADDAGPVAATASYDAATRTATLHPTAPLPTGTTFTVTLVGGGSGVRALDGTAFDRDTSWTFATAPVLVGAGDIADCTAGTPPRTYVGFQQETAALIAPLFDAGASVFTAGDNGYPDGSAASFQCFDASWGAFRSRLHPAMGNEDAATSSGGPYFAYFGVAAGPGHLGYYSYDLGSWHVVVLNSNCSSAGGHVVTSCAEGSAQEEWLDADLHAHPAACTLAVWHHPRWSSAFHSDNAFVSVFMQDLYAAGAELVVSGHDHDYERFQPRDPAGAVDPAHGVVQFVSGTGGAKAASSGRKQEAQSAKWIQGKNGVLELTLHPSSVSWRFVQVGGAVGDSGTAACHGAP